ncbi:hypothetical protein RvY_12920 [Ramazzottius varieornatus]|uniref:Uncharacterized protein n=1 Tax=Ramazzottius varieornatus TaxID=947166 RepID=A0A1D1VL45_RAMVA|nr:hypothetical protein RvY_12920 [Ramazzottius varieornatus]
MDGAKQFGLSHGSFISARRSQGSLKDESSRSTTLFLSNAAGDNGELSDGGFPQISLFDTLQLKLGKKTVENAALAADILRLQHIVEGLQKTKGGDSGAESHRFAELEAELLKQKQELNRAISDRNIYQNLHEDVNAELDSVRSEMYTAEQEAQHRIGQLNLVCQKLEDEKRDVEHKCAQQLDNQEREFEKVLENMRSTESMAEVRALEEEQIKHAEAIAGLLNDRAESDFKLQQALKSAEVLQSAHAAMEGKLQKQLSKVYKELAQCKGENLNIKEGKSQENAALVHELEAVRNEALMLRNRVRTLDDTLTDKEALVISQRMNHEEQVEVWRQRVVEAMSNSSQLMAETVVALEHRLAESDAQRSRLAAQNEQRAQEAAEHLELVRKEYDVIIKSLALQHEEDFKRRVSSVEEQFAREARQWKAEYEKIRDGQQQYARMVDARLEQHVKSLKDAHSIEIVKLKQQVEDLSTSSSDHLEQVEALRRDLVAKGRDLKSASRKASDYEKKYRHVEKKLNEVINMNRKLVQDVSQLRQLKDPSTIVETTLRAERENLRSLVEAENAAKVASSESLLVKKHDEAVAALQKTHTDSVHQLQEQLKQTVSERAQSRAMLQKLQAEVAADKRAMHDGIADLMKSNTVSSAADAQNHQIELRTLKENHRREVQLLKTEKAKAIKISEENHLNEILKLRAAHEAEKAATARTNEEVLRSYAQNLKPSIRKEIEEEIAQEIKALRSQHSSLIAVNEKALSETEQKCGSILESMKKKHQEIVNSLESKLATTAKALSEFEEKFNQHQQSVSKVHLVKEELERRLEEAEMRLRETVEQEASKRKTLQDDVRKEAEQKLAAFQEASTATIGKLEKQLRSLLQEMAKAEERERLLAQKFAAVAARNHQLEDNQAVFQRRLQQSEQRIPELLASR